MEINVGYGDGYGYGYGYGDGGGYGYGHGDCYGYGCGYGYGDGYGDGDGYGYGGGYGYGYGYGDGDGYGYGGGDGCGYGYGDGKTELQIPKEHAWMAYHYVCVDGGEIVLRNERRVLPFEPIHEDEIEMCRKGLHASLSIKDAKKYAPSGSVLTKVKVWGRIIVEKDKLVATDRQIKELRPQ